MAKKSYSVCLMRGDGIGPEIFDSALHVLDSALGKYKIHVEYREVPAGDSALRQYGDPLPRRSVEAFAESDACLKGPVGETVMDINTKLRFSFDLYANIRPAKSYSAICPLALRPDIDVIVIREAAEGFYRAIENEVVLGIWTCTGIFTETAARRIAEFSFRYLTAKKREKSATLALATKANIFRKTHGMYWRVFQEVSRDYPQIRFEHYYADALCARLVREPHKFDMIVSENLLADLLSDLVGQVAGGLGMILGTNINYETKRAYFEPIHGCAPDIVGKGIANPIGLIRAGGLMLEYLGMVYDDPKLTEASLCMESAVETLLSSNDKSILPFEIGGRAHASKVAESLASIISETV